MVTTYGKQGRLKMPAKRKLSSVAGPVVTPAGKFKKIRTEPVRPDRDDDDIEDEVDVEASATRTQEGDEEENEDEEEEEEEEEETLWKVKTILEETKTQYLIDWEDLSDGTSFAPTWEPKANANEEAVKDWEERKKENPQPKRQRGRPSKSTPAPSVESEDVEQQPAKRGPGRPRKVAPTSSVDFEDAQPQSARRGRGRPSKGSSSVQQEEIQETIFPDDTETLDNRPSNSAKRSVGRPGKSLAASRAEYDTPTTAASNTPLGKRGPGRPPGSLSAKPAHAPLHRVPHLDCDGEIEHERTPRDKGKKPASRSSLKRNHRTIESSDEEESNNEYGETAQAEEPTKRGVGRPRKHSIPAKSNTGKPKLPRGRPRKYSLDVHDPTDTTFVTEHDDITEVEASTQARHYEDLSEFASSQILIGTQPEPLQASADVIMVDAAEVSSLVQKHSEYESDNTSLSSETNQRTGQIAAYNSSSGVHTLRLLPRFGNGVVIPDSQSFLDASSYHISEQKSSDNSSANPVEVCDTSTESQIETAAVRPVQQTDNQGTDQAVPDSSMPQQKPSEPQTDHLHRASQEQDDPSTQSVEVIDHNAVVFIHSSPGDPTSHRSISHSRTPASAGAARSSSTSFPRPTEDPGILQSQPSQSALLTQANPSDQSSTQQPAQRRDIFLVDGSTALGDESDHVVDIINQPQPLLSGLTSSSSRFLTQVFNLPASNLDQSEDSPTSKVRSVLGRSLSDIPPLPSQLPNTFGDSAPSRVRSISVGGLSPDNNRFSMASPSPSGPLKQRLAAMRAASRAKTDLVTTVLTSPKPASAVPARLMSPMLDRDVRSPSQLSNVPPVEIIPEETPEEATRSERYETLLPGQEPRIGSSSNGVASQTNFVNHEMMDEYDDDHNQHIISIDFETIQRDNYRAPLSANKALIDEFTSKVFSAGSDSATDARKLVEELHNTVMHPDLGNKGTDTQSFWKPANQAEWDQTCSVKFKFLKHLLNEAKKHNLHIALLVEPGKFAGILQTFLLGIEIMYNVIDGENNVINEQSTATILWTTADANVSIPSLDLIVVLKGNMSSEIVNQMQKRLSRHINGLIPTFTTVIPKSVEHIERLLPSDMSEAERLHVLVATLTDLRNDAGWQTGGSESLEQKSTDIVSWVLNPHESDWSIYSLPEIGLLEPFNSSQGTNDDDENSMKRPLADDMVVDMPVAKKLRIEEPLLPMTINPQDIQLSHVSDSVPNTHQVAVMQALKDEFALREKELQSLLQNAQKTIERRQFEFEEQRAQLIDAQRDRDIAQAQGLRLQEANVDLRAKMATIREERQTMKEELEVARLSLRNHEIPDRAELENLRLDLEKAILEKAQQEEKAKSLDNQLDFTREHYQSASNNASATAAENEILKSRIIELENKASGEHARLRGMHFDNVSKKQFEEIRKLRVALADREATLARVNEEMTKFKENSRGRVGTRASSVPRSPRVGSPLVDRAPSRQGSPASTPRPPHPLRKG